MNNNNNYELIIIFIMNQMIVNSGETFNSYHLLLQLKPPHSQLAYNTGQGVGQVNRALFQWYIIFNQ